MAIARSAPVLTRVPDPSVDAWRRRDRAALEALFRTHAPTLERLLGRLLGASRADVEDALQTTFTEAIRSIPTYRGEAPIGHWLCRIAVRVALHDLDARQRTRRVDLTSIDPPHDAASPERVASGRQDVRRVLHHLEAISPKNRVAFVLHVVEGHTIEDVAALVGASVTATKSRVFLARRRLLGRIRRDPSLAHFDRDSLARLGPPRDEPEDDR